MVTINLDGNEVEVPAGINLVEAAGIHGTEVPHYCYHPQLSVAGNCRMCLVEMGTPMRDRGTGEAILDENGVQKIGWIPKPIIGCGTNVSPGMHIKTKSPMVTDSREGIMEFLLVNHPLDCPICDQAGECRLQEFATDYGRGYSRYVERKNVKPKRTKLGPRVTLDDERCILCSRCIRFCQEVVDDDVLGFVDRGSFSTLTCFPGKELSNNYSLNTVDLCPVGALTSTDFRFKMRVWFLKESSSICTESSAGSNILVSSREGEIHRITPRRNDSVNDSWMTDSGRELYKQVKSDNRLLSASVSAESANLTEAISSAIDLLKDKNIDFVDGGIIGPPANSEGSTRLYVSGGRCREIEAVFTNGFLGVHSLEGGIGKAAALKIAYAAWTKGSSALILAVRAMARNAGVEEDLLYEWGLSQPNAEAMTSLSATLNSPKAWRFVSEMNEISETFAANGVPNNFWDAAAEVYDRLKDFKNIPNDQVNVDSVIQKLIETNEDI